VLARQVGCLRASLVPPQNRDDLLFRVPALLHRSLPRIALLPALCHADGAGVTTAARDPSGEMLHR